MSRLVTLDPGLPDLVREMEDDASMHTIDDAMKQVLQNYAIDIDRIAVTGGSNGGSLALFVGLNNSDIFSRIVTLSAAYPNFDGIGLPKTNTQLILSAGTAEPDGYLTGVFEVGIRARNDGYPVTQILRLTGHAHDPEEDALIWRLLYESWTTSDSVHRTVPNTVAQPLLTVESVNRFAQFWASFMKEPDSIGTVARRKHQKCFTVPVGKQTVVLGMTDMIAMAAKYPSIAASLKAAGLTAKQAEASRLALISAKTTAEQPKDITGSVAATSVLGKNTIFFKTHAEQLRVLETLHMWSTP